MGPRGPEQLDKDPEEDLERLPKYQEAQEEDPTHPDVLEEGNREIEKARP